MTRQIAYRGPADVFDSGSMFEGKHYIFTAPQATTDADGKPLVEGEAGKAVVVNNEHAINLLTYPRHHFVEVEGEAPAEAAAPNVPAGTSIVADKPATREK